MNQSQQPEQASKPTTGAGPAEEDAIVGSPLGGQTGDALGVAKYHGERGTGQTALDGSSTPTQGNPFGGAR